jgi:large conductance mechanosensitive channel
MTPNKMPSVKLDALHEFMDFIKKYGVLGLAIGTIVGGAVKQLVDSIVTNLLSPLLGLIPNMKGLEGLNLARNSAGNFIMNGVVEKGDQIVFNYGPFFSDTINFLALMAVVCYAIKFIMSKFMEEADHSKV